MGRRYIIIGFATLAILLVVVGFVLSRTGTPSGEAIPTPSAQDEQISEYQSAGADIPDAPEGDTFLISTASIPVKVKNFYRSAVRVVEHIEVVIAETADYRISYIRPFTLFTVNVWGGRSGQTHREAERALLRTLNISETTACRLSVEVWLSADSGLPDAGRPLPLSFCKK